MRVRNHRWRRLAAWTCLFSWLLMVVGPLQHGVGHQNDHVHRAGAIVPTSHAATHADSDVPADIIAHARSNWRTEPEAPESDDDRERTPVNEDHGFDSATHLGAVPFVASLATLQLLNPTLHDAQPGWVAHHIVASPHHRVMHARGPPASSV